MVFQQFTSPTPILNVILSMVINVILSASLRLSNAVVKEKIILEATKLDLAVNGDDEQFNIGEIGYYKIYKLKDTENNKAMAGDNEQVWKMKLHTKFIKAIYYNNFKTKMVVIINVISIIYILIIWLIKIFHYCSTLDTFVEITHYYFMSGMLIPKIWFVNQYRLLIIHGSNFSLELPDLLDILLPSLRNVFNLQLKIDYTDYLISLTDFIIWLISSMHILFFVITIWPYIYFMTPAISLLMYNNCHRQNYTQQINFLIINILYFLLMWSSFAGYLLYSGNSYNNSIEVEFTWRESITDYYRSINQDFVLLI
jgi:hypothetical protein